MYLFCNWNLVPWLFSENPSPIASSLLYPATLVQWTALLTIVLWLCLTGNGGIINDFLSHKLWRPLSRLSYSIYVTHPWIIAIITGNQREPIWLTAISILTLWSVVVVLSVLVSIVFSILFEAPLFRALDRLRTGSIRKHTIRAIPLESRRKEEHSRIQIQDSSSNWSRNKKKFYYNFDNWRLWFILKYEHYFLYKRKTASSRT